MTWPAPIKRPVDATACSGWSMSATFDLTSPPWWLRWWHPLLGTAYLVRRLQALDADGLSRLDAALRSSLPDAAMPLAEACANLLGGANAANKVATWMDDGRPTDPQLEFAAGWRAGLGAADRAGLLPPPTALAALDAAWWALGATPWREQTLAFAAVVDTDPSVGYGAALAAGFALIAQYGWFSTVPLFVESLEAVVGPLIPRSAPPPDVRGVPR